MLWYTHCVSWLLWWSGLKVKPVYSRLPDRVSSDTIDFFSRLMQNSYLKNHRTSTPNILHTSKTIAPLSFCKISCQRTSTKVRVMKTCVHATSVIWPRYHIYDTVWECAWTFEVDTCNECVTNIAKESVSRDPILVCVILFSCYNNIQWLQKVFACSIIRKFFLPVSLISMKVCVHEEYNSA